MTTCPFEIGLLRVCVLSFMFPCWFFSFFFFLFFSTCMCSNCTFHAHDILCIRQSALFTRLTTTLFRKKILKMGRTTLFTHSKIILLRYFQFLDFSKISCIRTDPIYFENLTIDYMFSIFSIHMSNFVIIGYYLLYDA